MSIVIRDDNNVISANAISIQQDRVEENVFWVRGLRITSKQTMTLNEPYTLIEVTGDEDGVKHSGCETNLIFRRAGIRGHNISVFTLESTTTIPVIKNI